VQGQGDMKNLLNFNVNKLLIMALDRSSGFDILKMVKPTAFSVRRDGGFNLWIKIKEHLFL